MQQSYVRPQHGCGVFCRGVEETGSCNSSGFCQVFQRFATGCCRVIKVFDKTKADSMFWTGSKSDNNNNTDVITVLPSGFGKSLLLVSLAAGYSPIEVHKQHRANRDRNPSSCCWFVPIKLFPSMFTKCVFHSLCFRHISTLPTHKLYFGKSDFIHWLCERNTR